ncbi:MAG: hypothetical protein RLZZ435_3005, partial [Cyanobacteriota bacterium]
MPSPSFKFKLLRYLILCLGVSSSSVMAQVVASPLEEAEVAREADPALSLNQKSSRLSPPQLTFAYLPEEVEAAEQARPLIAAGKNDDRAEKSNKKSNKSNNKSNNKANKSNKKSKRSKQSKQSKQNKGYCRVLFQGNMTRGAEFTAVGSFSSETLIQIFEDETSFRSGEVALQTIEYTETNQSLSVGNQLGSFSIVREQTREERELTFQYLSTTDSNYTDLVINQTNSTGIITGVADNDDNAFIVISDLKGGKNCGKALKKCKRGKGGKNKGGKCGTVFIQQGFVNSGSSLETLSCSSETLLQVFEDERLTLTEFDSNTLKWQRLSAQLFQAQTWRSVLGFSRLGNQGFVINVDVLNKPQTTYANAVYQIYAQVKNDWRLIYNSVGARLIEGNAGSRRLPIEVINFSDLNLRDVNLTTAPLKAIVQIRYDAPDEGRDQKISFEFTESYQNLLQVTQVTQ